MRINIKHKGPMIAIVCLLILASIYLLPYLVVRHELKAPKAAVFDAKALMHDEVSALANTSLTREDKKRLSACMAHLTAQALKRYTRDTGNVILKPDQEVFGAIDITTSIKTQVINAITAGACDDFKTTPTQQKEIHMKRLLFTTSLIATMTTFGSALADNLSDSAKHDLTQVKPAPVQAILVHGAPIGDGSRPQVIHINTPEMKRGNDAITDSTNPRNSQDDAAFNVLAGTIGDNNQGFINLTKNILGNNEFFVYMLALKNRTPQIFDVLTKVMIIKELAQIHQDLVHRGACHG